MKVQKFTSKGSKSEDMTLPKEISVRINLPLLAQAVYVYEGRAHVGLRKTKTRAEVNKTTKKIYRQKGTGGARHGSRRAPIFVGGGIALGPRPIKKVLDLSKNVKNKTKLMAFSLKAEERKLVFVSGLSKISKTKEAGDLLKALIKATKGKFSTFVLSDKAAEVVKYFRNLPNSKFFFFKNINTLDIIKGGLIIVDEDIFEKKSEVKRTTKKAVKE